MKRTFTVLSTLAGLLTLLLSLGAMPASATQSQGYVGGGGIVTNDWGDEGTLSQTRNVHSGATELWQWVLYADGAKKPNGQLFSLSDIDGDFGPNTAGATRNWQSRHGVDVDGVVGPQTFGAADGHLRVVQDLGVDGNERLVIHYIGSVTEAIFERTNGVYNYEVGTNSIFRTANYVPPCIDDGTCS